MKKMTVLLVSVLLLTVGCGSAAQTSTKQESPTSEPVVSDARFQAPEDINSSPIVDGPGGAFFVGGYKQEDTNVSPRHDVIPIDNTRDKVDPLPLDDPQGFALFAGTSHERGIFLTGLACSWEFAEVPGCGFTENKTVLTWWSFEEKAWDFIELPEELHQTRFTLVQPFGNDSLILVGFPTALMSNGGNTQSMPGSAQQVYTLDLTTHEFVNVPQSPSAFALGTGAGISTACVADEKLAVASTGVDIASPTEHVYVYDGQNWTKIVDVPEHNGLGFGVFCGKDALLVVTSGQEQSTGYIVDLTNEPTPELTEVNQPFPPNVAEILAKRFDGQLFFDFDRLSSADTHVFDFERGTYAVVDTVPANRISLGSNGFVNMTLVVDENQLLRIDQTGEILVVEQ